ncbi:META and DUF4377 domain-containing protein [Diaphorobacter sp. HDW4A]|uniref:META and DUF4377 domain-containing protein n=1 Tax=Diaphorobacter sp. HDW4A TaxID=2714924 RepID=UPI00140B9FF8|nr:META and DUF4377 domain-containing protein [Diaphorobacter sp. HDW4A]QIL79214.1 META and DUF4377 domain-containing protein [Diaphorobacter sp. HDW4A]
MNPSTRLSAPITRLARLGAVAAVAAVVSACTIPQNNSVAAPAAATPTPAAPVAMDPKPMEPNSNAAQLLPQYFWSLSQVMGPDGKMLNDWLIADKAAPTLSFQNNQVSVQNLCNLVNAGYTTSLDKLELQRPVSTMRACVDNAQMLQERKVVQHLPLAQKFQIVPAGNNQPIRLYLTFADGVRWELIGQPTPATRFGSAGERIFLEVAPEKVNCNHPLMRDAKCLRVRDLSYDNKGIKRVTGDWRIMQGSIEGYNFEPGIRNVVRVNRYSLAKNGVLPADAPTHAYVLDMIVESERMR